jgi:hypothetical protein
MKNLILIFMAAILLASCTSTQIVKTWNEPGASVSLSAANKTMVLAMVKDETSRRVIEDQLVKRLNGKAVASYTVISTEMLKQASEEELNKKLTDGQFTHVLIMRLGDVEKETTYVQGTTTAYYGGYGRYYRYGSGFYTDPGYYTTDKNYFVETIVYSVSPNKLLWTGTTKTVNPSNVDKTVNEIADVVAAKMKKDGFLK